MLHGRKPSVPPRMLSILPSLALPVPHLQMRAPYSLSCLVLLSLGTCCPPHEHREPRHPGDVLEPRWQRMAAETVGPCRWTAPMQRRSQELGTLLGMARALQGYGQQHGGGPRGRQEGSEKRGSTLGDLAEELNGYSRKKGGFAFRFGR
ncbi:LOW QUALITY PROTEIN: orexigenic neuropeptide QRFP [Cyrtonyx montezumae]|uniref:LOW QUALITY PROTEIN: orexigenic neuropeptide QRFP n=1 Tax=Cyrtonyx montezumae TaxID=9017 RepID=UPI0032DB45C6